MAGFVSFVAKSRFRNPFRLPDSVPDRRACVFVRVGSSPLPPFFCGRRKMCGLRFVIFVARRFRIGFAGFSGGISTGKRSRFFRRERRSERNLRSALKSGIKRAFYIFGRLNKFKTVCRIDRFVLEKERVFSIFNAIFAILSCYMLRHFRTNDVHLQNKIIIPHVGYVA